MELRLLAALRSRHRRSLYCLGRIGAHHHDRSHSDIAPACGIGAGGAVTGSLRAEPDDRCADAPARRFGRGGSTRWTGHTTAAGEPAGVDQHGGATRRIFTGAVGACRRSTTWLDAVHRIRGTGVRPDAPGVLGRLPARPFAACARNGGDIRDQRVHADCCGMRLVAVRLQMTEQARGAEYRCTQ